MRVRAWLAESCSLGLKEQNLLGRLFIDKIQNVYDSFHFSIFFCHTHGLILVFSFFLYFQPLMLSVDVCH